MSRNMHPRSRYQPAVAEPLETRSLFSLSVLIGGLAAQGVQYVDTSGVKATLQIAGPGSATVTFNGSNLNQSTGPAGILVTGSNVTLASVAITNTGLYSALHIMTLGAGTITAGQITTSGVLAAILAPHVMLTGDLTTGGWVHQIVLAGAENGTLTIGPSHIGGGLNFQAGAITDESMNSSIRLISLNAKQWTNSSASQSIQAPQISSLSIAGAFNASMTIAAGAGGDGSIGPVAVGSLTGGTWNVGAGIGHVHAGSIAGGWVSAVSGPIASLSVSGSASVNFTAASVGSLIVGGDLSSSNITLTEPLAPKTLDAGLISVGGGILSTTIDSIGSIGPVVATRFVNSQLYAGILPTLVGQHGLPSDSSDLVTASSIASITFRRSGDASFVNGDIGAYTMGPVTLGRVSLPNGGVPFGVAAGSIKSVSMSDFVTGKSVQLAPVFSTTSFSSALAAKGLSGDLAVRIV